MGRKRLMIIPEPHIRDSNISSRIDYPAECIENFNTTERIAKENKADIIIYPGDIFDREINNTQQGVYWTHRFEKLAERFEIYSVVGNHELTYQTMFWSLITESPSNISGRRPKYARGIKEVIKVRDRIEIEGVSIAFIHYGGNLIDADIAITHGDYINETVRNTQERDLSYLRYVKAEVADKLDKYKYAFVGHAHLLMGEYTWDNGNKLIYLGSIGRTKEPEVQNDFLTRYIWFVDVEEGEIVDVHRVPLKLRSREEVLIEQKLIPKYVEEKVEKVELEERAFIGKSFIKDKLMEYASSSKQREEIIFSLMRDDNSKIEEFVNRLYHNKF